MGTSLAAMGLDPTPITNLTDPQTVKEITRQYIDAGADIIETATFSATSLKYGKEYARINRRAVRIATQAVKESGRKVRVAGGLGPTGMMVKPVGKLDFEEAVSVFKKQLHILAGEGVDLFIIETMDDISEMRAALIAVLETCPDIPVIATMTFSENERTSTGTPPEAAAKVMESLGADVIGVNCSFGPDMLVNIIRRMRRVTKKPLIAQANAGIPMMIKGKPRYSLGPEEYLNHARKLVKAGASYIGG